MRATVRKTSCFLSPRRLLAYLFGLLMAFSCPPDSIHAVDLLLGTGDNSTFSHFAGRALCRLMNRQAVQLKCETIPASDEVDNLTNLQSGSLDIALVDSQLLHDAIQQKGAFRFLDIRYDTLGVLLPFYETPITLVVRSDAGIDSLDALKGKRINAGPPGTRRYHAIQTIMDAKQWRARDFSLIENLPASQSQDTMAFCHGGIQAMIHIGVHPDATLIQLLQLCQATFVEMNDVDVGKLVQGDPAYAPYLLKSGTYASLQHPIHTFGTTMMLVASENLDEQTVQQIMTTIIQQSQSLQRSHAALADFSPQLLRQRLTGFRLHSGAAHYLLQRGW